MRLQIRVTPAHQELLDHLESVDREYRGKRIIALAAMQLAQMKRPAEPVVVQESQKVDPVQLGKSQSGDSVSTTGQVLKAPRWSTDGMG
ncbi:hypothetical protein [Aquipseudomonas alcaligenes]|uniref:hypothetical protein n=1 Tax=Aquipseudomonas alcaligenes TaxID=43263 RepID=UPI00111591B2|nr:hypothetical protein [Pseudomonas alcaligenes]